MRKCIEKTGQGGVYAALTGWAIDDPEGALEWVENLDDAEFRDQVWGGMVQGIAQSDPALSLRLLEELPEEYRTSYSRNLLPTIIQTKGIAEASTLFDQVIARAVEREGQDSDHLKTLFTSLSNRYLRTSDKRDRVEWAKRHVGQPYVSESYADWVAPKLVRRDVSEALEWIEYADGESGLDDTAPFKALAKNWIVGHGVTDLAQWLNQNPQHIARQRIAEGVFDHSEAMTQAELSAFYDELEDQVLKGRLAERLQTVEN